MDKTIVELIGYMAAVLTSAAYMPQAIKTIRTRKTEDISLNMYILMFIGVTGWLLYGIFIKSKPMLFANLLSLTLIFIILVMKLKYK